MIPNRPPPRLKNEAKWSKEFVDFVSKCLTKDPDIRPTSKQLLEVQGCQFYPKTEFSGEKPSYRHMVYLVFPPQDGWDCFPSFSR